MKVLKKSILLMLIALSAMASAQENWNNAKVEEMHEHKWKFIVEQANLSPSEVLLVKPIFLQYEKTIWSQHLRNREFFHSVMKLDKNNKPNYAEINDRYAEIEYIQGLNFRNYHLKLRKLLTPETLFNYYKAERDFKRKLLQNLPKRPDHHPEPDEFH